MASNAIRLFHASTDQYFIVKDGRVYTDLDDDNLISRQDTMTGPRKGVSPAELIAAADYFGALYETPYPGAPSLDRSIRSGGYLTLPELRQFEDTLTPVPSARTALERHLDFFDAGRRDGRVTIRENWSGWRRLGYGFFRSLMGTAGAAVLFGRLLEGFSIDIAHIKSKRPSKSTGIYDERGEVKRDLLDEYVAEFRKHATGGFTSQDKALEIIEAKAHPGTISRRQFKSLFDLCTRLNLSEKVINEEQFRGLFDGSLLYVAAAIPDSHGRRRVTAPDGPPRVAATASFGSARDSGQRRPS